MLKEITGNPVLTVPGELRKADIAESVLDVSLAQNGLAFEPQFSMHAGLVRTLQYHGVHTPKVKLDL